MPEINTASVSIRLIKKAQVLDRTGLSNSGLYAKIKVGEFPKQISTGQRSVKWSESEVNAWIESRIAARNS